MLKIREIQAKSVLSKCGFPSDDYAINPYIGCVFGCSYCYADFIKRFTGHKEKWGEFVDIKINAPEILQKEMTNLIKRIESGKEKKMPLILLSSICDPYQPAEAKYKITRSCLEAILPYSDRVRVNVLTKSSLVTRDIDIFKKFKNIEIGLTITSTDDSVSKLIEVHAPPASLRIMALEQLNKNNINTYVCINPLLPNFVNEINNLEKLFAAISKAKTSDIWLEHINLSGHKLNKVKEALKDKPDLFKYFESSKTQKYKEELNKLIFKLLKKYNFKVCGGGIIDHNRKMIFTDKKKNINIKNGWKVEVIAT